MLPYSDDAIAQATALIANGQPVAVPTETVYGLAGDATNAQAVAAIYEAKGRPSFNPLIVHVPDLAAAEHLGMFNAVARALAAAFWPGPLTLVVSRQPACPVASLATAGLHTIALRVPAHPVMQALLRARGKPLAAPSANASGGISPTRATHVLASLGGRISLIVDGGACQIGLESTILAVAGDEVRLLRCGAITPEAISAAVGVSVTSYHGTHVEAPGQMASHYAPSKPLRLNATHALPGEYLIGFGSIDGAVNLSPSANMAEAAAHLFDALHTADASAAAAIGVAPIPAHGLGVAINDRLSRAAF